MNIIKNSLPDDGFSIIKVSNIRKHYVLGSLEIPVLSDVNPISDQELARFRGLKIGFVFQTFNLVPRLTAFENVLLPTFANSRINLDPKRRASELFETMGFHNRMRHRLGDLSEGQSQRVSIARALINYPAIFLADEPTGNLVSITGAEIL